MARIKLELPDKFPFSTTLYIRIGDINYGGHLGNDSVLAMIHEARLRFLKKHGFTRYDPDIVKAALSLLKEKGIRYGKEKKFTIDGLKEGMVLSRPLYTFDGRFLLPYNTLLTEDIISKLNIIHANNPITDVIYVMEK